MRILNDIARFDTRLLFWCRKSHYYPTFISAVKGVSKTGDGYMQVLLALVVLVYDWSLGLAFLQLGLLAYAIERPVYLVLKNVLKRRRPPEVLPEFASLITASDRFSFPSGHSMAAFLLAGIFYLSFGTELFSVLIVYAWASSVAISRVILGVHFPTDILVGAALGSLLAWLTFQLI